MLVDLHAHYPMHLYPEARTRIGRRVRRSRSIFRLVRQQQAWFRALLRDMAPLQQELRAAYGGQDAELICEENGMRLLMEHWGGGPGRPG